MGVAYRLVDASTSQYRAHLNFSNDGNVYFIVKGLTATSLINVAYSAGAWIPIVAVATSATDRRLEVGASFKHELLRYGSHVRINHPSHWGSA